jgi:hypothetical protein
MPQCTPNQHNNKKIKITHTHVYIYIHIYVYIYIHTYICIYEREREELYEFVPVSRRKFGLSSDASYRSISYGLCQNPDLRFASMVLIYGLIFTSEF